MKTYIYTTRAMASLKIAVVTAMFLLDTDKMDACGLFTKIPGVDYILFTNNKHLAALNPVRHLWDIQELQLPYTQGVYCTKEVKWLTHLYLPDYDYIIWVDAQFTPDHKEAKVLFRYIEQMCAEGVPIAMRTQKFQTVYDDIAWCLKNNRITDDLGKTIIDALKVRGFSVTDPVQTFWTSAIIKNNKHPELQRMAYELIDFVCSVGYRDQHWLPYLVQKYSIKYNIVKLPLFILTGTYIREHHNYVSFFQRL